MITPAVWAPIAIRFAAALLGVVSSRPSPPGDPGPTPPCPEGTRLVERDHPDFVEQICTAYRWGHCSAYREGSARPWGKVDHVRVCMDQYEAPNVRGATPIVMVDAKEAESWCSARGKRLCSEYEFETACEGPEHRPFVYGYASDSVTCNAGKPWYPFDAFKLVAGGEVAEKETLRLWQGEPSGMRSSCVTNEGVYDLVGNAEEWVTSSRKRRWPYALVSGHWAKPWSACRDTNDAHEPWFRFYEVGFRCCMDPPGAGAGAGAGAATRPD